MSGLSPAARVAALTIGATAGSSSAVRTAG